MPLVPAPERVAAGAQLLDEKIPGWYKRINLDTLNLSNPTNCICGQLSDIGNWETVLSFLGEGPDREAFVMEHGFCADYATHELWVEAIQARLAHDALEAPTHGELVVA